MQVIPKEKLATLPDETPVSIREHDKLIPAELWVDPTGEPWCRVNGTMRKVSATDDIRRR